MSLTTHNLLSRLDTCPFLGILRAVTLADLKPLTEVLVETGMQTVEITMNTANAPQLIRALKALGAGHFVVGAGTVTSLERLRNAIEAGAEFIVMPGFDPQVVTECQKSNIPFFSGGLTPSEVQQGWQSGATMVKLFPASLGGPSYLKDLKGPFDQVKLLACGGIRADNAQDYFAAGASALAFGSSIFAPAAMQSNNWSQIKNNLSTLLATRYGRT